MSSYIMRFSTAPLGFGSSLCLASKRLLSFSALFPPPTKFFLFVVANPGSLLVRMEAVLPGLLWSGQAREESRSVLGMDCWGCVFQSLVSIFPLAIVGGISWPAGGQCL